VSLLVQKKTEVRRILCEEKKKNLLSFLSGFAGFRLLVSPRKSWGLGKEFFIGSMVLQKKLEHNHLKDFIHLLVKFRYLSILLLLVLK
jgi:hypothetical protein